MSWTIIATKLKKPFLLICAIVTLVSLSGSIAHSVEPTTIGAAPAELDRYNVVWASPSKDDSGSMPLGNGQLGINLWVEENGDLHFYLSRNDSLSEISQLVKVGAVRVALSPNPFTTGAPFRQELLLRDGVCEITAGQGAGLVKLRVFVDSEKPVIHVCGTSASPLSITVSCESWRTTSRSVSEEAEHASGGKQEQNSSWTLKNAPFDLVELADVFPDTGKDCLAWYHRNESSIAVDSTIELQSLQSIASTISNPLLHLTFGGWIVAQGLRRSGTGATATLSSPPLTRFDIRVAAPSQQTSKAKDWLDVAEKLAEGESSAEVEESNTKNWWNAFWNRSWVLAENTLPGGPQPSPDHGAPGGSEVDAVTRGYLLQRYMQACAAGGPYPIKFNGSIFSVAPKPMGLPYNPDWRRWGDCFWWQNTRLPYHPMLASGDFEMMQPLFDFYSSVAPICEARAKLYHDVSGCYFPETMTHWGTYANDDYGWNRTGLHPNDVASKWWRYAWNQGPELVALMLDRWDYTGDTVALKEQTLPMAESVLRYFDTRFKRDAAGRLIISPTQSAETYWSGVTNDMPSVAGLIDITTRLCALPIAHRRPDGRIIYPDARGLDNLRVEEGAFTGKNGAGTGSGRAISARNAPTARIPS